MLEKLETSGWDRISKKGLPLLNIVRQATNTPLESTRLSMASAAGVSKSVRGDEYERVRVDVAASEVVLGAELARGGASVVFRGTFAGAPVAVKQPSLGTRADMDRYHTELQLLRHAEAQTPLSLLA